MIGGTEILKKLSRAVEINDAWRRGYAAQIQAVARQFIEDDCMESNGEALTPDHYAQLQQYIDDKNETLQSLSRYISNNELFALWRRIEPYRNFTANSRELLKILIKLEVAHILLERLNSVEDDANLDEDRKVALKTRLDASIQNLNNRALAIPADPDDPIVQEQPETWWSLFIGNIKQVLSKELTILRHSPQLWRADIPLKVFCRNLFWVSCVLFKAVYLVPFLSVFMLPMYASLFFIRHRPSAALQGPIAEIYKTTILIMMVVLTLGLLCLSFWQMFLLYMNTIGLLSMAGSTGLMATMGSTLGLMMFSGVIAAPFITLGFIVGVGGYRCIIRPIADYVSPTPRITREQVFNVIQHENNEEFHERFEIQPELTAVIYPLHIPLEYQVMLSNQDLEGLKLNMVERRLSEPDLQEELVLAHDRFRHETPAFETFKTRFGSAVANLANIDEQPFRPRPS